MTKRKLSSRIKEYSILMSEMLLFLLLLTSIFAYMSSYFVAYMQETTPPKLPFEIVSISATLAGFVLVASRFGTDKTTKQDLFRSFTLFIFSTIAFIIFYILLPLRPLMLPDNIVGCIIIDTIAFGCTFITPFFFSGAIFNLLRAVQYGKYSIKLKG